MDGFFGIEIARKALQTSQYALDVTAHNIANANTPGYTRQRVIQGTTPSFPAPSWNRPLIQGQLGTGVMVQSIQRVRDSFFDGQIRRENQSLGGWEVKKNGLEQIETIFNEPSDGGLLNIMGQFWDSWQQLSKNPESTSTRSGVLETGRMLATTFNQLDSKLSRVQDNLNEQVLVKVNDINSIARRVSELNRDILRVKTYGAEPNDMLDERDLLIDKLSKMVDVKVAELDTGATIIYINGSQLVSEYGYNELEAVSNPGNGFYDVKWKASGIAATIYGGEIKALTETRDVTVPAYKSELDVLAASIINEVNSIHFNGIGLDASTGLEFFSGIGASDMAISMDVSDPRSLGASLSGEPGDNSNALALAKLKNGLVMSGNTITMDDYYRSLVTNLGVESQQAAAMTANGKMYFDLIESHRQSVAGVSLDEEATNMIKFQRAYQAAARLVTMFDEMLDVLINQMVR
ncbi:MAG: flagellar hook-associated protein FlgK [Candidatus Aquicultor primus]|uniref:Flagellar hook-associated protein 1 n=1 Tax=Candidatus Aquicultor primus TaxID=1797195 RepID=A0A1F2UKY1_9ACTN|nr:MAG: flagellar hook-associated protein FlgK [Candidatus Aquicultor primus]HCG99099.1 flagellar hook-associated protein FlgK [Actinomycetota bacterium]